MTWVAAMPHFGVVTKSRWLTVVGIGLIIALVSGAGMWWAGRLRALESLAFVDVSATTAARAMQEDHFFSDYGDKILVVHGTVMAVQGAGKGRQISLRTDSAFGLTCAITGAPPGLPTSGAAVTLVAPGGSAQRQPASVALPDCRVLSSP